MRLRKLPQSFFPHQFMNTKHLKLKTVSDTRTLSVLKGSRFHSCRKHAAWLSLQGYVLLRMSPVVNHIVRTILQNNGDIILLCVAGVNIWLSSSAWLKTEHSHCERDVILEFCGEWRNVTYGNDHQLSQVELLEATMRGFTGCDIFHALERVPSRYVGR